MKKTLLTLTLFGAVAAKAQNTPIFRQDFSASTDISAYVKTPDNGGVGTTIGTATGTRASGAAIFKNISFAANTSGNIDAGKLNLVRTTGTNSLSLTADSLYFNSNTGNYDLRGNVIVLKTKLTYVRANGSTPTPSLGLQLYLGSDFLTAATGGPITSGANGTAYMSLGFASLRGPETAANFTGLLPRATDQATNANITNSITPVTLTGEQTITWIINATKTDAVVGNDISYKDFSNADVSLPAGQYHIYVGTTKFEFTGLNNNNTTAPINAATAISQFQLRLLNGTTAATTVSIDDFSIEIMPQTGGTLPVHFSKPLTASVIGNNVKLSWATASEQNSKLFEVQRSKDGRDFTTIQNIAAAGNSATEKNNSYTDYSPFTGTAYYQLKQVDIDGKSKLYGPVAVRLGTKEIALSVSESSATSVKFSITAQEAESGTVSLYSLSGQKVASVIVKLKEGKNVVEVPTTISNQVMIVKVETPKINLSKKFLKN